ncbi:MAG: MBL fold metallo-hydrolase [Pyrobaculum sp.]
MSIKVPLPGMELGHVNVYVAKCDDGYGIIDVGLATYEAALALIRGLKSAGIKPSQVSKVFITHFHADHITLAQLLAEIASPDFYIGWEEFLPYHLEEVIKLYVEEYRRHGVPTQLLEGFSTLHPMSRFRKAFEDLSKLSWRRVKDGEKLDCGLEAMWTPGHTPGHMVYMSQDGVYTGDHVLPKITPNISWIPKEGYNNPLEKYLASLHKTNLKTAAYPAHGSPIPDLSQRVEELLAHHHRRLEDVLKVLTKPMTLYEVATQMPWDAGVFHQFDVLNKLFAIGETYSHLIYLEAVGKVERVEKEVVYWRPV